jgi:sugar lactone lactonase YvrE
MKRAISTVLLFLATAALAAPPRAVVDPKEIAATKLPRATTGPAASLPEDPKLEIVALLPGPMPAGVALSKIGRTFLTFPMWGDVHDHSLLELHPDGSLTPYPSPLARFSSIQGICTTDTHLYALDAGAAKLHVINLSTNGIEKTHTFPKDVLGQNPYLNDLRIDPVGNHAYISDSSVGGVIVLNLSTGHAVRRLSKHPAARATPDFRATVEGVPLKTAGNTDGIALSPDGSTLYFNAFSSHALHAIPTKDLRDDQIPDEQLSPTKLTTKPSANDGLTTDPDGNIYSTDYEDHAIRLTTPAGDTRVLVQDPRLLWPDALWAHDGYLYITTNQLNRLPSLNNGKDRREQPYALFRYPLP